MTEINIIDEIARRDAERLHGYRQLLDFYQGRQWPGRERWGEKQLTFNYARVFVDKLTSYLMSGAGFTVEAAEDTAAARTAAEQAKKALYRVYEDNNLAQLDYETETDCAVLGDGCYKVIWEPREKRVRVTAPDIQGIFAWWQGDDITRVWRVASRYRIAAEEAARLYGDKLPGIAVRMQYPGAPSLPATEREVVEVWTDAEFVLYLDGARLESKRNPYGFIPFIIFPNLREPKHFWGTSDLAALIEPQRELNRALSQVSHILELSGNPVAVLENVEASTDIAVRPGAVWNIPEDAKAYLLDLLQGGGLQLHINYIDLLYRAMHDLAEAPRAAFGGIDRNLSGVAMQIELYPLLQKVLRKRAIRSAVYNRRHRLILELLRQFGGYPGAADGDRVRTVWGNVLPQDAAQLIANERTLVQEGIHSRRQAMDEVGIRQPEAEFRRWLEEKKAIREAENGT